MRWDGPPIERRLHAIVNDNITAIMEQKNLTVHDVADGSGMSATTLQWRLNRPSTWQLDELADVAKALGVPVASLFELRPQHQEIAPPLEVGARAPPGAPGTERHGLVILLTFRTAPLLERPMRLGFGRRSHESAEPPSHSCIAAS
jgi:transcriptional regulator with XRE-family HTH domain